MSETVFNTITGADWKRSIAAGRAHHAKAIEKLHNAFCKVDRPHPLTYQCGYSKEWRCEKCLHCPHDLKQRQT